MFQELFALPTMGGALLAGVAYAALSAFVTGPLVAERTIEKSGWPVRCARQSLPETAPDASPSSSIDCAALLGMIYGKEGAAFCARYGGDLSRFVDVVGSVRPLAEGGADAMAAGQAAPPSPCGCAVRSVIEDRRLDFAIYAGMARLVTPLAVRILDDELGWAARSPACTARGGTR